VSPCHLFLLPYPTVCECSMLQCVFNWKKQPSMEWTVLAWIRIWRWGEAGGALPGFWLAVVECSHQDGYHLSIYSALNIIYEVTCLSYPFVHPMSNSYYSIKICCLAGFTRLSNILFRIFIFKLLFCWFLLFGIIYQMSDFEPILNNQYIPWSALFTLLFSPVSPDKVLVMSEMQGFS
jgi:hypothetical protein